MGKTKDKKDMADVSRYISEGNPNTSKAIERSCKDALTDEEKQKKSPNIHNQLQVIEKK